MPFRAVHLALVASALWLPAPRARARAAEGSPLPPSVLLPTTPPSVFGPAASEGEGAGEKDRLETDRDSFTPATTTVGKGRLVVESAYSFLDNRGIPEGHSLPEFLLRYGLTRRIELRLGWNYEFGAASDASAAGGAGEEDVLGREAGRSRVETEGTISYGIKFLVSEQKGWIPTSALILGGRTPTNGEATDTHFAGTYVFGWELPNRWRLDAALRYGTASEGEDHFGILAPSIVLKVPVAERWNVHGEYFGLFSHERAGDFVKHYFSPGVHYLVTDNLEVGVRVGWGLNDQAARVFANTGFGLRF